MSSYGGLPRVYVRDDAASHAAVCAHAQHCRSGQNALLL